MGKVLHRLEFSDDPADVLEITASGAVTGPDQVGGQHFGTSYNYCRVAGGPWAKIDGVRSMHRARTAAEGCGSAAEAFALLAGEPVAT